EFDEDDKVKFTFPNEDNKQLFFSKVILSRCSPMFKAMFKHDFKEKKDNNVNIEDIKRVDFIQFLKFCDPMLVELPKDENVFEMVEIAEKYQNESMIKQCRRVMSEDILPKDYNEALKKYESGWTPNSSRIIKVLSVASTFNYKEVLQIGESCLACFEVRNLLNTEDFEKLPADLKFRVLSKRVMNSYQNVGFKPNKNLLK
ncbi:BAT38-like protein, partial [Mya arenaria]